MPPKHEHRLSTFAIELFEKHEWLLLETETSLLISVYNVQSILPPIVGDIVALQCDWQDNSARIVDTDTEAFEDLHLRVVLLRAAQKLVPDTAN